jgi:hypothetical protein
MFKFNVAKLLGVSISDDFSYYIHVSTVLELCAQRLYLLRLLRNQGLSRHNLSIDFHALVLSQIVYCQSAWGGYVTSDQRGQINPFFRRAYTRQALIRQKKEQATEYNGIRKHDNGRNIKCAACSSGQTRAMLATNNHIHRYQLNTR